MTDAMVFLTYTLPADAFARGYGEWLVAVDNPFFNAIPGVGRYENWRIDAGTAPGWTYFDFLALATPGDLERVWFNRDLDDFRKGWIAKWGYGATKPAPVNTFGYLMEREGVAQPRTKYAALRGYADRPAASAGAELWRVTHAVRKHYAIGPAPSGQSWQTEIAVHPGPGFRWLSIDYRDEPGAPPSDGSPALLASLIAGPS